MYKPRKTLLLGGVWFFFFQIAVSVNDSIHGALPFVHKRGARRHIGIMGEAVSVNETGSPASGAVPTLEVSQIGFINSYDLFQILRKGNHCVLLSADYLPVSIVLNKLGARGRISTKIRF